MNSNTLVLNRMNVGGILYPPVECVGEYTYLDFGALGCVRVKITQVSDSYATYEFPSDFDLTRIKEQIYETRKKAVSIQSVHTS